MKNELWEELRKLILENPIENKTVVVEIPRSSSSIIKSTCDGIHPMRNLKR